MPILFNIENTLIKHAFFVKNSNKRTSLLLSKLASDKLDALSRIFHTKSIAIKQSVVNSQTSLKKNLYYGKLTADIIIREAHYAIHKLL